MGERPAKGGEGMEEEAAGEAWTADKVRPRRRGKWRGEGRQEIQVESGVMKTFARRGEHASQESEAQDNNREN